LLRGRTIPKTHTKPPSATGNNDLSWRDLHIPKLSDVGEEYNVTITIDRSAFVCACLWHAPPKTREWRRPLRPIPPIPWACGIVAMDCPSQINRHARARAHRMLNDRLRLRIEAIRRTADKYPDWRLSHTFRLFCPGRSRRSDSSAASKTAALQSEPSSQRPSALARRRQCRGAQA
jgi:hypothetical protein